MLAKLDGDRRRPRAPLDHDAKLEIITSKQPEALETIRHDAAHIVADAVQRLFPGTQVTIGPTIENGFYYDFDRDKPFTEAELAADREAGEQDRRRGSAVRAQRGLDRRGDRAVRGQGREVQGRDHRGHRREGREDAHAVQPRRLGRLLPRPARSVDRQGRRDQDPVVVGGVLARRSSQQVAPADLRHRVLRQEGARCVDSSSARRREARPSPARQGARPVPLPPVRAGRGVLDREGHRALHGAVGVHAQARAVARLRRDQDAAALQQGPVGDQRALGQVQGEHVPRRGQRGEGRG